MKRHGARAFVEALIAGRRPARFHPSPDEVEELRTAIELSAARPGADIPDAASSKISGPNSSHRKNR
jgi:hypothetical protein